MLSAVIRFLVLSVLLSAGPAAAGQSIGLGQYKTLRNEYVKVTDIKERERFEERYQEINGKVTLQKVPYKEVMLTAELIRKPPSSMDTMFVADAAQPDLKICMVPFDAAGKALDESCDIFKFQSFVRGNIGTTSFRLDATTTHYEFHMVQRQGEKGSAIKLWVPTN